MLTKVFVVQPFLAVSLLCSVLAFFHLVFIAATRIFLRIFFPSSEFPAEGSIFLSAISNVAWLIGVMAVCMGVVALCRMGDGCLRILSFYVAIIAAAVPLIAADQAGLFLDFGLVAVAFGALWVVGIIFPSSEFLSCGSDERKMHSMGAASQKVVSLVSTLAAAMLVTTALALHQDQSNRYDIVAYFIASVNMLTWGLYCLDKLWAEEEMARVPEVSFHALALLGGTPTAYISQQMFRHKTRKFEFQLIYWIIVVLQVLLLVVAFQLAD